MPRSAARTFLVGVVILAAGQSKRMGLPKMLLPWGRTSVLGHLMRQWRRLGVEQVAVVCATGDQAIQAELDRLRFPRKNRIANPAPERGMFSSIRCAAQWPGWKGALTHWAIVLGDQPHLRHETLRRAIEFTAAHPHEICQPMRGGHRRHPVFLPREAFLRLTCSTAADLKEFLSAAPRPLALCEVDDPGLDLDIDRPEDYARALRMAGKDCGKKR